MSSYRFDFQGGIERASYELAGRVAGAGHAVTLVAHDVDPAPAPGAGLAWHQVRMPPHHRMSVPLLYPALASRQLDHGAFDVVHNQGGCALRHQDVITAHSCHRAWVEVKRHQGERLRALLNLRHHEVLHVERANYRPGAYQQIIAVSTGVKREIEQWYEVPGDRITVIPNGVDLDRFHPADHDDVRAQLRARLLAEHGVGPDDVLLLWVGKEFRRKGLAPSIDALTRLPASTKLLVIGGDDRRPYEQRARDAGVADRVVFLGHSDAVHRWFQAADVFVLPTLYEAFALVTLEAAAAGLPLVTTKVNGTEELVEDGINGRFVERDGEAVAAALLPLVTDPHVRWTMGARARAAVQGYSWDANASRTLDLYREVLDRKLAARSAVGARR